ncbi:MAG TPA: DUF2933 domain-containing protein [Kofleriaceae bacterium]|nr:DUF2933 domain-containing protein [Kofleriaceae bacterium]
MIAAITHAGIAVARSGVMTTRDRTPRLPAAGLLVFGAFVVIAGFFLFEEHRAHVLGALPYILGVAGLLFCIFGHRHAGTWRTHDDEHGGAR